MNVGKDELDEGKVEGEEMKKEGGKKGICVNKEVGNV